MTTEVKTLVSALVLKVELKLSNIYVVMPRVIMGKTVL